MASLSGGINLQAGEDYQQTASQVVAVEGDIRIQAQQVSIVAGYDTLDHSEKQSSSRTAIGGAVNVPVVDAAISMQQVVRAATHTDDPRMQALAAATVAMQGKTAYDNAKAIVDGDATGIKFSVSLSHEKSKSESTQQSRNVVASSVTAGGDVRIQASGTPNSDVKIIGSTVNAGRDIDLKADRNILLLAAENTAKQNSKNSGSGWSAGIGLGIGGAQNGFSLDLAANQFRGKSDGSDSAWSNTELEAGRQVNLESGQDTELKGAVVKGEQVTAKVGGNLTLESLQDTSTYTSKNSGSSIGASLCIPGFCAGASTVSGSLNSSKVKGDYASVTEQSGIKAGDGGFQIEVQGHTDLTGAIIASSDSAVENNLNRLETNTLAFSDISNFANAKATSKGVNLSSDMLFQGKYGVSKGVVGNVLNQGSAKDSSSSQTLSGVSGGEVKIRDEEGQIERTGQTTEQTISYLNRDTDNSHTPAERLNIQALEREAEAERIIKQAVFAEVVKFTDDAYHTMFIKEHKMYEVILDRNGKPEKNADGTPKIRELSFEEKKNLQANGSDKVHVAANGIFNDPYDAAIYAAQNNPELTGGPLYIVSFPKADSLVAELMVAGYQKHLENNFWGLTNSTEEFTGIMRQHGMSGLELDAHSRGSMTIGNAMESLSSLSTTAAGVLSNTFISFFGAAYSAEKAAELLYELSGGKQNTVNLQNHKDDFVGGIIGGNPYSHDRRPENSSKGKEWINMFKNGPTVHSCYGVGKDGCGSAYGVPKTIQVESYGKNKK
ncbi:MAG TPA: hemagglutinin repeat-containing protein [Oscillospiraceae bacterium]|nr:hemagglutinin repeat-containing protein [Oscillospiraceae bacterium]